MKEKLGAECQEDLQGEFKISNQKTMQDTLKNDEIKFILHQDHNNLQEHF